MLLNHPLPNSGTLGLLLLLGLSITQFIYIYQEDIERDQGDQNAEREKFGLIRLVSLPLALADQVPTQGFPKFPGTGAGVVSNQTVTRLTEACRLIASQFCCPISWHHSIAHRKRKNSLLGVAHG